MAELLPLSQVSGQRPLQLPWREVRMTGEKTMVDIWVGELFSVPEVGSWG